MNAETFNRLHSLRMDNDAAGFAMEEIRPRFQALENRYENGTAPRAVSAFNLFQTPVAMAATLIGLLELKPGERILEPSAGLGRLIDACTPFAAQEIVAIEMAPQCASELFRQERTNLIIKQRDFLTVTPADIGQFDAIAMNPPFHMRADIRHIEHALKFLRPGGRLAAICMSGPARTARLKPLSSTWIECGAKQFEATQTATVMMLIKKS